MAGVDERSPLKWEPKGPRSTGTFTYSDRQWATSGRKSRSPRASLDEGPRRDTARFVTAVGIVALVLLVLIVLLPYDVPGTSPAARLEMEYGEFTEPAARSSTDGVLDTKLEIAPLRVKYRVGGQTVEFTTRAFEGSVPGPTLRLRRGDELRVDLVNALGADESQHWIWDELGRPNHTILHTHGLHVSPTGHSDNMFVTVPPGGSRRYEYRIGQRHPTGTFWFHPHAHGSSALQTAYSLAGIIVIMDEEGELPDLLRGIDEHVVLVQGLDLDTGSGRDALKLDAMADTSLPSFAEMEAASVAEEPQGHRGKKHKHVRHYRRPRVLHRREPRDAKLSLPRVSALTVNAVANPVLRVRAGTPTRLRLVHAAIDGWLSLDIGDVVGCDEVLASQGDSCACSWWDVARDGAYHATPRRLAMGENGAAGPVKQHGGDAGDSNSHSGAGFNLLVPPGSRADIVVHCSLSCAECPSEAHVALWSKPNSRSYGMLGHSSNQWNVPLMIVGFSLPRDDTTPSPTQTRTSEALEVTSPSPPLTPPSTMSIDSSTRITSGSAEAFVAAMLSAKLPRSHEHDLREVPDAKVERFVVTWTQGREANATTGYTFYGVNGVLYDPKERPIIRVKLGSVQEWVISTGTAPESHPFHLHTNPFQVVAVNAPGCAVLGAPSARRSCEDIDFRVGDWRDTITVPADGGNVTVRWRADDFVGKSLAHCHILAHEDEGMMFAFDIVREDDNK